MPKTRVLLLNHREPAVAVASLPAFSIHIRRTACRNPLARVSRMPVYRLPNIPEVQTKMSAQAISLDQGYTPKKRNRPLSQDVYEAVNKTAGG